MNWRCEHAQSGCNYPEGECVGLCEIKTFNPIIENKQAEPVAQPYAYVYEFDSGMFGVHRSFSPNERNGSKPSRVVPVFTHPAPAVAVNEKLLEAARTAVRRFELLALHNDSIQCGARPSFGAKELQEAIAAAEKAKGGV